MPGPSQAGEAWTSVMIFMPVLALEEMHNSEPSHVAARILSQRSIGFGMTDAVHEALRVEREHQADRAEPEEGRQAKVASAEVGQGQDRRLKVTPDSIRNMIQVGAVTLHRRRVNLPQPSQMSPPESVQGRTRDVIERVRVLVMHPVGRRPRSWCSGAVEHRQKD